MLARDPVAEHSDRDVDRRDMLSRWRNTPICTVCKDSCTLSWGEQTSGRNTSAVLATVLVSVAALSVLAAALLMPAGAAASAKTKSPYCAYANLRPTSADTASVDAATLCLLNQLRATHHLLPLRSNHELQAVATTQVNGMVRRDYFGDDSPSGQSPAALIETLPYGAHAASLSTAQDLGWGTLSAATAAGMVAAWMRSPPHREIILTAAFRDAGVGVAPAVPSVLRGGRRGATYAVEFAARG
jgi:uncharacterized protein YkwD